MRQCCCIVCGEPIERGLRWMHRECAQGDGYNLLVPYREWPQWAKWLLKNERTLRAHNPCDEMSLDEMLERYEDE